MHKDMDILKWFPVKRKVASQALSASLPTLSLGGRLLIRMFLFAVLITLPVLAQIVTYPPPTPPGGPALYIPGYFKETIVYSNCELVVPIPDNVSISNNSAEFWLFPLHIQANITGDYVAVQLSTPPNLFTLKNGISEGQGYSVTAGPVTLGAISQGQTYSLSVSGSTLNEKFVDTQTETSTYENGTWVRTITSTYNIVTGVQVLSWDWEVRATHTHPAGSQGCDAKTKVSEVLSGTHYFFALLCKKANKSYNVTPFYQSAASYKPDPAPAWPSECYNNYLGNCSVLIKGYDTTIGARGCTLTALAMLLNWANVPGIDPGTLNDFMKNPNDLYDSQHNVNIGSTVNALRARKGGKLQYVTINKSTVTTYSDPEELADALDNGPVMVALDATGPSKTHFAIVTSRICQADGYRFSMIDPGTSRGNGILGPTFYVRGYVADPPDLSELIVGFTGTNGFITYDGMFNETGLDPVSGQTMQNIPNSHYTSDYISDPNTNEPLSLPSYFLDVKKPVPGVYRIVISGLEVGSYDLTVRGYASDGTGGVATVLKGKTTSGSSQTYIVNYSADPSVQTTGAMLVGDLNGDGVVNCADIEIVKGSFGKRTGQQSFDTRADVNGDGIVNILDLSTVARQLPVGTVCH